MKFRGVRIEIVSHARQIVCSSFSQFNASDNTLETSRWKATKTKSGKNKKTYATFWDLFGIFFSVNYHTLNKIVRLHYSCTCGLSLEFARNSDMLLTKKSHQCFHHINYRKKEKRISRIKSKQILRYLSTQLKVIQHFI